MDCAAQKGGSNKKAASSNFIPPCSGGDDMRRLTFLFLAILLFLPSIPQAKELSKVAVWDLEPREVKPAYARELTSILVSEISKMGQGEVYSQDNVRTLAGWTAEKMQLGCTDAKCLTALGQMDITRLISGSVGKIGNRYSVSLNLFDTKNAKAENAVSEFGRSEDELIDLVQLAARKLLGVEPISSKVGRAGPEKTTYRVPRILFEEHFQDNRNSWLTGNNKAYSFDIKDGWYILESKAGGFWYSTRPVSINQNADFKIELKTQKLSGTDEYGYGLVWGCRDSNNFYFFVIFGNGEYSFQKCENGVYTRILAGVGTMINKFNGQNKLTVKKVGDSLEFYVNDLLANRSSFLPFFENPPLSYWDLKK